MSRAEDPVSVKIFSNFNSFLLHHIMNSSVSYALTVFHSVKLIIRVLYYFNTRFGGTRLILANELADTKG